MAAHFMSLSRGEEGFQFSDYTTGTATNAGTGFVELRVDDNVFRRIDIIKILEAYIRVFENPQFYDGNASGQTYTSPPGFGFLTLD